MDDSARKILIIDDEIHIRLLLEQALEELEDDHDVEILSAPDGAKGLTMVHAERPALVFLDIMMPTMDGYEVCRQLLDTPPDHPLKIVLLTAKGQETDKKQGLDLGASLYMTKPFDPDTVAEVARKLLKLEGP